MVVVSAHYDHEGLATEGVDKVYNGADDDGSGTTAVLEIEKLFRKLRLMEKVREGAFCF